jgi:serine O-acetyltransferase
MTGMRKLLQDLRADYQRHGKNLRNLAFWAIAVYRYGRWAKEHKGLSGWAVNKIYAVLFLFVEITTGITLHREVKVGEGFHLVHSGNIKIYPRVVIGDRCGIMHDVTLGTLPETVGAPRLGNDVFIGSGAKVLGPLTIGDGGRVAANSLVLSDVPPGATAIGVPARIILFTGRKTGAPAPDPSPPPPPTESPPPSS